MAAAIVSRFRTGGISAEIAVMQLLIETEDLDLARAAAAGEPALTALIDANAAGCERIVAMLRSDLDSAEPASSVDEGLERTRRLFDGSVAESEEASVALYSLGSPEILAAATAEVVAQIERGSPLGPTTRVVELGCGIGRFLTALAPRVRSVHGVDVSPAMVEVARRRCAAFDNVTVGLASGRDLAGVGDASAELVLAVDVFPYVVHAGDALVDQLFGEIARVLVPDGRLLLFQLSYRGDPDLDRADVARHALRHGFEVLVGGERRLTLWDGSLFALSRAPTGSARSSAPPRAGA